jgi:hypothetical protein
MLLVINEEIFYIIEVQFWAVNEVFREKVKKSEEFLNIFVDFDILLFIKIISYG